MAVIQDLSYKKDIKNNVFNLIKARKFYKAELSLNERSNDSFDSKKITLRKDNFINFDVTDRIIAQKITEVTIDVLNEYFAKGKGYFRNNYIDDKDINEIIQNKYFSMRFVLPILQSFTKKFLSLNDMSIYMNNQINLLTGQYFSALILHKIGIPITIPKNDIDVFILDFQNRSNVEHENKEFSADAQAYATGFEDKSIFIKGSEKYKISNEAIPINFTTIIPEVINEFEYKDLKMRYYLSFFNLLENFDLNIVKIGLMYDLNNNLTLIIHPDFIEFIKNKQFDYKIKNIHLYEEIRIAKKINQIKAIRSHFQMPIHFDELFSDLSFYFDKQKYLKCFLAQDQAFDILIKEKTKDIKDEDLVSQKNKMQSLNFLQSFTAKYYDFINQSSWINLKVYDDKILNINISKELLKKYNIQNNNFFEIIQFINLSLEDNDKFHYHKDIGFLQLKKLIIGLEYSSIKKLKKLLDYFIKHKNEISNWNLYYKTYGEFLVLFLLMQIVIEPELLKLEIDKIKFHIINYLNHTEYRNFYQIFIDNVDFIKLLMESKKKLENKLKTTLSKNEFELINQSIFIKIINIIHDDIIMKNKFKIDFDVIEELTFKKILKEIEENNRPLINYEKIEFTFYAIKIEELYTPLELQQVGNKMHHCVGSYVSQVKNENSIIFQIEHKYQNDFKYTCEIDPLTLVVRQIRGFANALVKEEHKKFIEEIINIIKQKLMERYNLKEEDLPKIQKNELNQPLEPQPALPAAQMNWNDNFDDVFF